MKAMYTYSTLYINLNRIKCCLSRLNLNY